MSDFLSGGRLEDHPFAELSGLIFRETHTGELTMEDGNRRRSVWFLGGNPVAVVSADPQDHLAQFLLEHGKIGDEDARRLADLPETREALGGTTFLPKDTLNWGVKSRFVNLCYDLFRWESGDYFFHEGDPPRDLFLLKVPAHSLLFKGVGLLGMAAVIDVIPNEAVLGAGPVSAADARYLSPDALLLLQKCLPGRTVAEVLGESPADLDQNRRLLYAFRCLGLIAISQVPAAALTMVSGHDDDAIIPGPAPADTHPGPENLAAEIPLEEKRENGEFVLNLPPLNAGSDSFPAPDAERAATDTAQRPGGSAFEDEPGSASFGSFGSFNADTTPVQQSGPFAATGEELILPEAGSTSFGRHFHVPRIVGITLGSIAAAGIIAFVAWWWSGGSEPPAPPVKPPPRGGVPVAAPAPAPRPAPLAQAVVPAPAPAPSTPHSPAAATTPAPASPAHPSPAVPAAVGNPAARPAPVASAQSGMDRRRNALELFRTGDFEGAAAIWEAVLTEEHRGEFTLQLITACQRDTIRELQRSFSGQELYLVTKNLSGRVCYRVCLGTFDSRDAAGKALAGLSAEYRSAGASVRLITDVFNRDR